MYQKYNQITEAYLAALMDPQDPPVDDSFEAEIAGTINNHDVWLQVEPKTIMEIATHLFPDDLAALGNNIDFFGIIMYHLLANGYHAAPKTSGSNTLVWRKVRGILDPLPATGGDHG